MTFTARQMAQSAIKSMHQSQTMEVEPSPSHPLWTRLNKAGLTRMFLCSGMFVAYRGEVCRHSEGQGAEAHGAAAAAADAAAQCSFHMGKPDWSQQPGPTVPGGESPEDSHKSVSPLHVAATPTGCVCVCVC